MYRIIKTKNYQRSVVKEGITTIDEAQKSAYEANSYAARSTDGADFPSFTVEEYQEEPMLNCDIKQSTILGRGLADTFRDMAAQGSKDKVLPDTAMLIVLAAIREIVEDVPGTLAQADLVEKIGSDYQHMADMQELLTQSGKIIEQLTAMLEEALAHLRGE